MRRQPENTRRLCRLINDSLAPFNSITELSIPIPKQTEKQLLISLSNTARQIKLWTEEYDDSDSDTDAKETDHTVCTDEDHHCLTKIVIELVSLLEVKNIYVQHIAGNILVVISKFLAASGSCYDKYVYLLALCLELSTCNCLQTLEPSTRFDESHSNLSASFLVLKQSLKSASWYTAAGVISVLRNMLKHLKMECDDQLLKGYLNSVRSCILNIPWNVFEEVSLGEMYLQHEDALNRNKLQNLPSLTLFNGNLVQFFCSLAAHGSASETSAAYMNEQPVACIIGNVMPKILGWCLRKQDHNNTRTSQYLRHKILKLMVRLTYQMHLQCEVLVSWLNIIGKYFQDLLAEPLTRVENNMGDSLEGSPFLISFSKDNKGISDHHLQRLAVFLFLRCSLSLVCQRDGTDERCVCDEEKLNHSCCNRRQGILGLYQWLRGHIAQDMFADNDIYIQKCTSFSLSFLQLFMHEDDILFKVLLQLFTVPLSVKPVSRGSITLQKVEDEDNMYRHISDLLNPICLFHLFLAELLYDYQVLLDYLISKDTGASSAEYLLRCLRAVCDSWISFVEFSWDEEVTNYTKFKKRKVLVDVLDLEGGESSVQRETDDSSLSLTKRCMRKDVYTSRQHQTTRPPFERAMECLLSLKSSLLNLHRKKLFPYNPDVLLRRLTKIEELCLKQKNLLTSE
ncbi:hypothetical protein DCAR_0729521 [Daucus carota subsp. sativus]|uniref:Protein Lines C-terminal domain-containing protein n=2 Tax=Daucus carota subsp. sativus TaxID=79200 RepID=A0AAF0XLN6_DAUCS|nr:hypothetical protein DCAR_0729521 [Daucus carota subsp. sativus]